uniref:Photosystem I assembly protein Ycf4 n=1 Tax=Pyramimonas parkeae TaxID=36894 RepID=A0A1P8AJL7_9CHLO|nr:hypothetical chloroplast RF4 [Pyramimonas parkeae]
MVNFSDDLVFREQVIGSRRLSNYWWATLLFFGATCFFTVGLSSYLGFNLLPFLNAKGIIFFPQGLVMCFYGILAFLLSIYLWLIIFWSIGEGYNEFNKKEGTMCIFRWGFPGKNRRVQLTYFLKDIEAIRVELKEGWNPRRILYIRVKGRPEIPLTRIGQPMTVGEIEKKAAQLASFLQVSIEGLN